MPMAAWNEHLLVTPYNIRRGAGPVLGLDSSWLQLRHTIFSHVCSPSVAHQSQRRFTWILLIDPKTPSYDRELLTMTAVRAHLDTRLLQVPDFSKIDAVLRAEYDGPLLVSRLDSDDALEPTHIERVQTAIRTGKKAVQFIDGWLHYLDTGRTYRLLQLHSPFFSTLTEPGAATAAALEQGSLAHQPSSVAYLSSGFIRTIHSTNMWGTSGLVGHRVREASLTGRFPGVHLSPCIDGIGAQLLDAIRSTAREGYLRGRQRLATLRMR